MVRSTHVLDHEFVLLDALLNCSGPAFCGDICGILLVEDEVFHELEGINEDLLQVYMLRGVLLMGYLLEGDRLMGERSESGILGAAIPDVLANELALLAELKDGTVLVEDDLSFLALATDETCGGEGGPPEDSICDFIAQHVGRR